MAGVEDHPDLFEALVGDEGDAPVHFRPTAYWQPYRDRVARAIRDTGLAEVQRNQVILKGYAAGGVPRPTLPSNRVRRAVFTLLERTPPITRLVAEYQRLVQAQYREAVKLRVMLARSVLDRIAAGFPHLRIPENLDAGGAEDLFEWNNMPVSAAFVPYLARAADFYRVTDAAEVTSLLEIGPGLGLSTLAHHALNPNCRTFVNVDISTTAYVATQFLRAVDAFEVVDYLAVRDRPDIPVHESGTGPHCLMVPPWMLPRLSGGIDWFHNAFSFQEMERDVVDLYAAQVKRLVKNGAWLISSVDGHRQGAGGQKAPVRFSDIEASFSPEFTCDPGSLSDYAVPFGITPECNRHYRRRCQDF